MSFLLPLILAWLSGAAFLLLDGTRRWVVRAAATLLAGVFLGDVLLLGRLELESTTAFEVITGSWPEGAGIRLRVDRLGLFFAACCALVLAAVMLHELSSRSGSRLLPALLLLLCAGLHGAFFTADLFNFYVFFELSVVSSFALAAYGYGRTEIRGTFIYICVNLFGSVLFLIGVTGIYHAFGTLDLRQLAERAGPAPAILNLPTVLLFAALSLKLGLFPFHGWVPAVYSHARPVVAAALSGALVNLGAYGLLRLGFSSLDSARQTGSTTLIVLGALAAVYGGLLALHRKDPAEIIAYSAVVQAGYIVLALGIGGKHGVIAALLTVVSGSLDKATMFLTLSGSTSLRSSSALIAALGVSGLPITVGFLSKLELFRAVLALPGAWLVILPLVVSVTLVMIAVFRYWRMVRESADNGAGRSLMPPALASLSVALGIVPGPILGFASELGAELLEAAR